VETNAVEDVYDHDISKDVKNRPEMFGGLKLALRRARGGNPSQTPIERGGLLRQKTARAVVQERADRCGAALNSSGTGSP